MHPVRDSLTKVGDRFKMLVTNFIHWENHQHDDLKSVTNGDSPSQSHQHNDVTNITFTLRDVKDSCV